MEGRNDTPSSAEDWYVMKEGRMEGMGKEERKEGKMKGRKKQRKE
jgi:hypothetical protein